MPTAPLPPMATPCLRVSRGARRILPLALLFLLIAGKAGAQINPLGGLRNRIRAPSAALARLFGGEPPLTTSLEDAAANAVPELDGFTPAKWSPLEEMPLAPGGTFWIAPGAYTFDAQSFCLQPGTYSPRQGEGYLHADLKGPRSAIVRRILGGASDHPRIPQTEIQKLLWAIMARAKVDRLPASVKATAAALLTPQELLELSSVGLPAVSDAARQEALASLPAATRQVLEAEDDLRRLMDGAEPGLEELDRVAVLAGQAPPASPADRIPEGRWSYHSAGYFIRYLPITRYTQMRIQIYFPEEFQVRRDASGRITIVPLSPPAPRQSLWQAAGFWSGDGAAIQGGAGLAPFQPGGGSGVGPGQRQRSGSSARRAPPPNNANNNVVNKAQQVTSTLNNLSTPLGVMSGDMGLPGWMVGNLLDWNFSNAQQIDQALGGNDDGEELALGSGPRGARFLRASWGRRAGQDPDYMTLTPPPALPVLPSQPSPLASPAHLRAGRAVQESALRLAATLRALELAHRRFRAASQAGRTEWVTRQARAMVHLKYAAGGEMLELADALAGLQPHLGQGPGAGPVAGLVREAQRRLVAEPTPTGVMPLMQALGQGETELARYRRGLAELDAERAAADAPAGVRRLADALRAYGEHWQTLPEVAAPWR